MPLVDQHGNPLVAQKRDPRVEIGRLRSELAFWKSRSGRQSEAIQARYDAASFDEYSERHWANSDFLSPDAANDHYVRRRLRSRSRYETIENNSYLRGMALSMANDFTGSGPRMEVIDPRFSKEQAKVIERRFADWARCIRLRQLIWRLRMGRFVDGESFCLQISNPKLMHPVKLDWWIFEPDQCGYGYSGSMVARRGGWRYIDGIRFNRYQQVDAYFILNTHPGGRYLSWSEDFSKYGDWVKEQYVVHWFRQERAWLRGIPETVAILPLCAILRRYTLAVLHSAETAADFAGVLTSTAPPYPSNWSGGTGTQQDYESFDSFPLDKGMFTTIPYGYELSQLKAEQPTTVYDKFVESILKEISRSLMIPFNVASGYSGGYNFASGTLDRQLYQSNIRRDRDHCEDYVLSKILYSWWNEALRVPDYLFPMVPAEVSVDGGPRRSIVGQLLDANTHLRGKRVSYNGNPELNALIDLADQDQNIDYDNSLILPPQVRWTWDDIQEHADPVKVAQAAEIWHRINAVTDADIQRGRFNRDPDQHYENLEEMRENRERIGLTMPGSSPVPDPNNPNNQGDEDSDNQDDGDEDANADSGDEGNEE